MKGSSTRHDPMKSTTQDNVGKPSDPPLVHQFGAQQYFSKDEGGKLYEEFLLGAQSRRT